MKFELLANTIEQTHQHFLKQASKAVNVSLTLRNWFIGFYIVEFEQKGEDRASYGARLLDSLAEKLNTKGLGDRNLKLFRQFYLAYPELKTAVVQIAELPLKIAQLATTQSLTIENKQVGIVQLPTAQSKKDNIKYMFSIIQKISFTHFVELMKI